MYAEDSFFTLSPLGRVGLVLVSVGLSALWLALTWALARGRRLWLRLAIGAGAFVLFAWLSPQAYYQYYHLLFDDLPHQWVIRPLDPMGIVRLLIFQADANLSAHSQGVLGWGLLALACIARGPRPETTD